MKVTIYPDEWYPVLTPDPDVTGGDKVYDIPDDLYNRWNLWIVESEELQRLLLEVYEQSCAS